MKSKAKKPHSDPRSPIVATRSIPPRTQLLLAVRAGGRCQFDGCNQYLYEHHVTRKEGNFSENAHIVAFRTEGPRGGKERPHEINDIDSLMLLCDRCHKLVDRNPSDYTAETLREYKARHEERVFYVTGLGPDLRTSTLVLQANIGAQAVWVSFSQILEAIAPRYPVSRKGTVIDLTGVRTDPITMMLAAQQTIEQKIRQLYEPGGEVEQSQHISVFALAPIPILVFLGTQLSNKIAVDVYQRHRDTESWSWKGEGKPVSYLAREIRSGKTNDKIALLASLSGPIGLNALPQEIDEEYSVYELTLKDRVPSPTFLRLKNDLDGFRIAYQDILSEIVRSHGLVREIHFFPAVPAPIAVLCGRELLPKLHPALLVYDYDKREDGFKLQVRVNEFPVR